MIRNCVRGVAGLYGAAFIAFATAAIQVEERALPLLRHLWESLTLGASPRG